jgi:hypothetical protein
MSLSKEIEKLKHDKRLSDWYVSRGHMTKEEYQKQLAALPDLAGNVEPLHFADEGSGSVGRDLDEHLN